jgi:hypothetical protein
VAAAVASASKRVRAARRLDTLLRPRNTPSIAESPEDSPERRKRMAAVVSSYDAPLADGRAARIVERWEEPEQAAGWLTACGVELPAALEEVLV